MNEINICSNVNYTEIKVHKRHANSQNQNQGTAISSPIISAVSSDTKHNQNNTYFELITVT